MKEEFLETLSATLKTRAEQLKEGKRVKHSGDFQPEDVDHWLWDDADELSKDYIPYEPYTEAELPYEVP